MFGWLLDSPEKKARKADLSDLRYIMKAVRTVTRNTAEKAGQASERVLIEDSALDAKIAKTYGNAIHAMRESHRTMSVVEQELERKIKNLGVFSRFRQNKGTPVERQLGGQ
jgi:hypothetical protein